MALAVAAWSEEEPNFSAITRSLRLERLGRHCAVDCIGAGRPLDPDLPKMWRASPALSKVGQGTTEIRTLPRRRSGRVGSVAANLLGFGRRDAAAGGEMPHILCTGCCRFLQGTTALPMLLPRSTAFPKHFGLWWA